MALLFELKAELNLLLTFCVLWYFYVCHTQQQNTAFENYFLKLMFGNISTGLVSGVYLYWPSHVNSQKNQAAQN